MAFLLDQVLRLFLSALGSILSFVPWYSVSVLFHNIILFLLYKMLLIYTHTLEHSYYTEQFAVCLFSLESSLLYGSRVIYQPMIELFPVWLGHAAKRPYHCKALG